MTCYRQGLLDLVAAPGAMQLSSCPENGQWSPLLHRLQEVKHENQEG